MLPQGIHGVLSYKLYNTFRLGFHTLHRQTRNYYLYLVEEIVVACSIFTSEGFLSAVRVMVPPESGFYKHGKKHDLPPFLQYS